MEKQRCAICGAEATQTHHLSYDPEIVIQVCIPCHMKVHQHGVGKGKGQVALSDDVSKTIEEKELLLPLYTKKEAVDDTQYIKSTDGEILDELVCPNCSTKPLEEGRRAHSEWNIFHDKRTQQVFVRCPYCGVDFETKILPMATQA